MIFTFLNFGPFGTDIQLRLRFPACTLERLFGRIRLEDSNFSRHAALENDIVVVFEAHE